MPTVAYVVQAFADDMTLLLFLPTPLVHACCNCMDWFNFDKKQEHQQKLQLTLLTATTLPHICLQHLTIHNTLLTPNLVSESPCPF